MPGIVGLLTGMPRRRAEPQLLDMLASMWHEPSYQIGTWIDESLGVYVGWTVRGNSFLNDMPVQSEGNDVVVVLSGEVVPEAGAAEDDPSFPARLNGRFHGLRIERSNRTATLFNDRFGMHRLYYHESKEAFYFAAEAKAILSVQPRLRRLDPRGLGEFVACGCVLENRSLFDGIGVLPGAAAWKFRNGTNVARTRYFEPREWENQSALEPESFYGQIREIFSQKLPAYFGGRKNVGMSLTGGLDTRMVMAWQRLPPGSLPCYTFGSTYRDCADVRIARRVARVSGQPHQVIPVGDEFLSRFAEYAEQTVRLTDGCADVSRAPDLYLNRLAREIAPVRMTGNYGSEVLRGVRAFKPIQPRPGLFTRDVMSSVDQAQATYARVIDGHPLSFAVFRQAPWHHYGLLALEQTQLSVRSPFLDNDLVRTVFRAPDGTSASNALSLRLIADGDPALGAIATDRGPIGTGFMAGVRRGGSYLLRRAEYAYDYGMPQWVAPIDRHLHHLHLERVLLGRQKFSHFRLWYRDVLSGYVRVRT
jgi:asparagine synthase (glutamine-hydrolysing)